MKLDTNAREISLSVADWPPAKDGGCSIFNPKHRHHARVVDLPRQAKRALADSRWNPREKAPIGLELVIFAPPGGLPGDVDNYFSGVADVLKAIRLNESSYLADLARVSFYIDDQQIEEMRCYVDRDDGPSYRVRVWVLS